MMGCHGIDPANRGRGRRGGAFWGPDAEEITLVALTVFDVKGAVVSQGRSAEAAFWVAPASFNPVGNANG